MLLSELETRRWLAAHGVGPNFTIRADRKVDVEGDINLSQKDLTSIPVNFGVVSGEFIINDNKLTNLEFAPETCKGFNANFNQLTNESLANLPLTTGTTTFGYNPITSLEFLRVQKYGALGFLHCPVTSLEGISDKVLSLSDSLIGFDADIITRGGIGLLLIDGLHTIMNKQTGLPRPFQIIDRFIRRKGERLISDAVFDCQNELINDGYEAFAIP